MFGVAAHSDSGSDDDEEKNKHKNLYKRRCGDDDNNDNVVEITTIPCGNCGELFEEDTILKCPCTLVYYCSTACQAANWHVHKRSCSAAKLSSSMEICSQCRTTSATLHVCHCLQTYYCSLRCQQKHWPRHGHVCQGRDGPSLKPTNDRGVQTGSGDVVVDDTAAVRRLTQVMAPFGVSMFNPLVSKMKSSPSQPSSPLLAHKRRESRRSTSHATTTTANEHWRGEEKEVVGSRHFIRNSFSVGTAAGAHHGKDDKAEGALSVCRDVTSSSCSAEPPSFGADGELELISPASAAPTTKMNNSSSSRVLKSGFAKKVSTSTNNNNNTGGSKDDEHLLLLLNTSATSLPGGGNDDEAAVVATGVSSSLSLSASTTPSANNGKFNRVIRRLQSLQTALGGLDDALRIAVYVDSADPVVRGHMNSLSEPRVLQRTNVLIVKKGV